MIAMSCWLSMVSHPGGMLITDMEVLQNMKFNNLRIPLLPNEDEKERVGVLQFP